MNSKSGKPIKLGDQLAGRDWYNQEVTGQVVAGDPALGQPELVLKHGTHGHLCPSLDLTHFLHHEKVMAGGSNPEPASLGGKPSKAAP